MSSVTNKIINDSPPSTRPLLEEKSKLSTSLSRTWTAGAVKISDRKVKPLLQRNEEKLNPTLLPSSSAKKLQDKVQDSPSKPNLDESLATRAGSNIYSSLASIPQEISSKVGLNFDALIEAIKSQRPLLTEQEIDLFKLVIKSDQDEVFHLLMESRERLPIEAARSSDMEGYLFKCLLQAKKQNLVEEQILHLLKLGDLYIAKNDLHKGAKLLNGALALLTKYRHIHLLEEFLFYLLAEVQVQFYKEKGIELTLADCKQEIQEYRFQLKQIRIKCKQQHERQLPTANTYIKAVLAELTRKFKELLIKLIDANMQKLGEVPTNWACISLGSMGRKEMCPNSDIECAVLIQENSDEAVAYFRTLFQLIEFQMINLGETRFPIFESIDEFNSSPTPSGFSMDIGGNTPLGVPGVYELIGTPYELAQFLDLKWIDRNIILPNALSNGAFLTGHKKLFEQYQQCKREKLSEESLEGPLRKVLAFRLLKGHLEEFQPDLGVEKKKTRAFGIKKELYRPFQEILGSLSLFIGIEAKTTCKKIRVLTKSAVFSYQGRWNLNNNFRRALCLRMEAHLFYQDEKEYLCHPEENKALDPGLLYFKDHHREIVPKVYRALKILHNCAKEFYTSKSIAVFRKSSFYGDDLDVQAYEAHMAKNFWALRDIYQQQIALDPQDPSPYRQVALAEFELRNFEQALPMHRKAVELAKIKHGDKHPFIAHCLCDMGASLLQVKDKAQARDCFEKALEIYLQADEQETGKTTCYRVIAQMNVLEKEKLPQALTYIQNALEIYLKLHGEVHANILACYQIQASIYELSAEFEQELSQRQKALKLLRQLNQEDNEGLANCYSAIANGYYKLKQYDRALEHWQQAIDIYVKVYPQGHSETIYCYIGMAKVLTEQGNNKKAQDHYQKAIAILSLLSPEFKVDSVTLIKNIQTKIKFLNPGEGS